MSRNLKSVLSTYGGLGLGWLRTVMTRQRAYNSKILKVQNFVKDSQAICK